MDVQYDFASGIDLRCDVERDAGKERRQRNVAIGGCADAGGVGVGVGVDAAIAPALESLRFLSVHEQPCAKSTATAVMYKMTDGR